MLVYQKLATFSGMTFKLLSKLASLSEIANRITDLEESYKTKLDKTEKTLSEERIKWDQEIKKIKDQANQHVQQVSDLEISHCLRGSLDDHL